MTRSKQLLLIGLVALASVAGGLLLSKAWQPAPEPSPYAHLGGDFTLASAAGPVSLSDFRGKVVAIYFGYTYCPDVCPAALGLLGQALRSMQPDQAAQVQPLMISVDPERDTPERLASYVEFFHPSMRGLTGSDAEIADVAKRYKVYYERVEMPDSAMGYAMDHSSRIYIIDREGTIQTVSQHGDDAAMIQQLLREVLAL
jgi:protein SCO1/2